MNIQKIRRMVSSSLLFYTFVQLIGSEPVFGQVGVGERVGVGGPPLCSPVLRRRRWSAPVSLTSKTGARSIDVDISANGDAMVVWYEAHGSKVSVRASHRSTQLRNSMGRTWSQPIEVANFFGESSALGKPFVAMDAQGSALVVWEQPATFSPITNLPRVGVYARPFKGGLWKPAERIDVDRNQTLQTAPASFRMAMNKRGEAIVAWYGDVISGTMNVYARRRTIHSFFRTDKWEPVEKLSNHVVMAGATVVEAAMGQKGNALVAWEHGTSGITSVSAREFKTRNGWQAVHVLNRRYPGRTGMNEGSTYAPKVAASEKEFVVIWVDQVGSPPLTVFGLNLARFRGFQPLFEINLNANDGPSPISVGDVALNASGFAVAAWKGEHLVARGVSSAHTLFPARNLGPVSLDAMSAATSLPQVALGDEGYGLASWIQINPNANIISARSLQHRLPTVGCPEVFEVANAITQVHSSPSTIIDFDLGVYPTGAAVIAWTDQSGSVYGVSYQ